MAAARQYVVERETHIAAPRSEVHDRIADLHRWEAWSPWEDIDPEMRRSYSGTDSGIGAVYQWAGNRKAGSGRMEIIGVTDTEVVIDLRFLKPFKSHATTALRLAPDGNGTHVTWQLTGDDTGLTRALGLFLSMDKMIGPDFEKGLARLKVDAEADGRGTP
jgi:hypothetical protein